MDGSVHDVSTTYPWANAFAQHVATLNSTNFAGHNDWRVPDAKEPGSTTNNPNVAPTVSPALKKNINSRCTVVNRSCTPSSSGYRVATTVARHPVGARIPAP